MTKPVKESDLEWFESQRGTKYASRRKQLGAAGGAKDLGVSLMELPPGKTSVPFHAHLANEEAVYVLEGEGTLRTVDGQVTLAAGDFVSFPAGHEGAHQLTNTGDVPMRYLAISTMREPDVTVYPDSNKIGVFAGAAPGGPKGQRTLNAILPLDAEVGYWDGEE